MPIPNHNRHLNHLSNREYTILHMLSRGISYAEIAFNLKISKACLHTHTSGLRRKTGIRNTKDKAACRRYMLNHQNPDEPIPIVRPKGPTPHQMECLKLRAKGLSPFLIGQELKLDAQTVQNAISQACKRIGIKTRGKRRIWEIGNWIEDQERRAGEPVKRTHPDWQDDFI